MTRAGQGMAPREIVGASVFRWYAFVSPCAGEHDDLRDS